MKRVVLGIATFHLKLKFREGTKILMYTKYSRSKNVKDTNGLNIHVRKISKYVFHMLVFNTIRIP